MLVKTLNYQCDPKMYTLMYLVASHIVEDRQEFGTPSILDRSTNNPLNVQI